MFDVRTASGVKDKVQTVGEEKEHFSFVSVLQLPVFVLICHILLSVSFFFFFPETLPAAVGGTSLRP